MNEIIQNLKESENEINNIMDVLEKAHTGDTSINNANLRTTITKVMDKTKDFLLKIVPAEEFSNEDGNRVITATKKETNLITDSSQLKRLTLSGVPSNTGLGSQTVVTASTSGARRSPSKAKAKAKVAGATAPAVTTAEKDDRSYILAFLERIGNKLKSFFQWLLDKMKQVAQDVKDAVCTAFSTVWGWLKSAWACLTGGS